MRGIVNSSNIRWLAFVFDLTMAVLALVVSLILRHGSLAQFDFRTLFLGGVLPFAAATSASLLIMRTYRTSWRHASTADLTNIVYTVTLAILIYLPIGFVVSRLDLIPRSSVVMAWMILILLMSGSRIAYRLFREGRLIYSRRPMQIGQVPILIVGGGSDAEILLRSLDRSSEYYPVGVLDNRSKGALLRGIPVLGGIAEAEKVIDRFSDAGDRPRKLVVVDRDLAPPTLAALVELANRLGLTVARGPDPTLLRPEASEEPQLQPISVEDLLGRAQVVLDPKPVRDLIAGRRVLVTGAGGSIGAEIVRQVCAIGPAAICLVDASEFNLYTIDIGVAERWPAIARMTRIIDVRHKAAIEACFAAFKPELVFHAAALKHVPLVEANPVEGIWTNVIGSRNVCDAASAAGCVALVLISSDKAVNPTNIMGASKRAAEGYCQALALAGSADENRRTTRFVSVRFGNVLGSTGSVVPLFERQLRAGGPLTVTHPDIERFFMTIREAVQLVLQASALGAAKTDRLGRVFVLDMGEPVRIADLARQMIRLAGLRPDKDIEIKYTGLRPGEKLSEELFHEGESIEPTGIARVDVASPRTLELGFFVQSLTALEADCQHGREADAVRILHALVPEYGAPEYGAT